MDHPHRADALPGRLSRRVDNFGTGYSLLGCIERLPVDGRKIHQPCALGMQTDADDATAVRSSIDLAHNLGLSVATEGAENAAVLLQLRALACAEAQGDPISRTLPVYAFWARHAPAP